MKNILVLGAGLSASSMLRYLLDHAEENQWHLRVTDVDFEMLKRKLNGNSFATALQFNALERAERLPEIEKADLVISMLPARFHIDVAKDCVELKTHLITPSYISAEMKELHSEAKEADIIIMNEIGVDPGIDHMSAMKIIDEVKAQGGKITGFKSFCGGLIAPESDNNPWNYKFTWNPRNVVLAGQGGAASFIRNGEYKYIPYQRLFNRLDRHSIPGYGDFVGYANRDSLSYRATYGLEDIETMFRGTLRRPGYCEAWNVFVELGMTDDTYAMVETENMTARRFVNAFLPYDATLSAEDKFKNFLREDRMHLYERFEWLDLFNGEKVIGFKDASPAQLLQAILVNKLSLEEGDKDMLVMLHEFEYELNNKRYSHISYMVNIGEDQTYTSMSNTVGLPVAICAKMILQDKIHTRGVTLPIESYIYEPILEELEHYDIKFVEEKREC